MSSAPVIEVKGVSKWYGNVVAVNDVSFQLDSGVTGVLGPNGAGKTTLLRMLSGLAAPSKGQVTILGQPARGNPNGRHRIGVMTEHDALYDFYTGRQFVELAARLHGLANASEACDRAIRTVGMEAAQHRAIRTYSRGMRQRIRLAWALAHEPRVLVLDEPLSGTDPIQRMEFQRLVSSYAAAGKTVVISSHILEEVETVADRILLMISGRLAAFGDYRVIRAKLNERPYKIVVECDNPRLMAASLVRLEAVQSVEVDAEGLLTVLSADAGLLQRTIPRTALDRGVRLTRVEPLDDSLESVFAYLVEG